MVYSFQKDLIEKNRRNKRKEPKKNLSRNTNTDGKIKITS